MPRCISSVNEIAGRLTAIIQGFLGKLPLNERKKKVASAHKYIQNRAKSRRKK